MEHTWFVAIHRPGAAWCASTNHGARWSPCHALLMAGMLLAWTQPLQAQEPPFTDLVVFGDSLSDSGQFPDQAALGLGIYQAIRFTTRTGPGYTAPERADSIALQILARELGLGELYPSTPALPFSVTGNPVGNNYAVAGNTTAKVLASITSVGGSLVESGGTVLNQRDGYLVDHPAADPGALYWVNAGGNDIIDVITDGAAPDPVSWTGNYLASIAALHGAGARYIVVSNAPDIGAVPLTRLLSVFTNNPALPATMSALTDAYNGAVFSQLPLVGANVIPADIHGFLNLLIVNPGTYGFDPAQAAFCFDGAAFTGVLCAESPAHGLAGAAPNPEALIFYDGIHPTAKTHRIFASYLGSILMAPQQFGMLPEMQHALELTRIRQLASDHMALAGRQRADGGRWELNARITRFDQELHNGYGMSGNQEAVGGYIGANYRYQDNWLLGLSVSYDDAELDITGMGETDLTSIGVTAATTYLWGRALIHAQASYHRLDYDNSRMVWLGDVPYTMTGSTEGDNVAAYLRAGWSLLQAGSRFRIMPLLGLYYLNTGIDAFSEDGLDLLAYSVGDIDRHDDLVYEYGALFGARITEQIDANVEVVGMTAAGVKDEVYITQNNPATGGLSYHLPAYRTAERNATVVNGELTWQVMPGASVAAGYQYRLDEKAQHTWSLRLLWSL